MIKVHDLYFEKFITQEKIQQRVQEIGESLTKKFREKNPLFVGVLNGAFIFTADLVRACHLPSETTFIKVASYDGMESTGNLATQLDFQVDIQDRHLIIVEDIIDSGFTLHQLLPKIQANNPSSITLVSLLVKPTALQYPLPITHIGFEIPDKFVIGYGLDYREQGRNLLDIYQLKE